MSSLVKAALAILAVFSNLVFTHGSFAAETVRINGTGSGLVALKPLTAAFRKENRDVLFEMEKSLGSSAAIKAVGKKALDVAISGRRLKPAEEAQGMVSREYGRSPFAVMTNRGVPAVSLTMGGLAALYSGKTAKWPGGERVRVVLRPVDDTDTALTRSLSPEMDRGVGAAHARKDMLLGITDNEAFDYIKKTDGAVAVMALAMALSEPSAVHVLKLDGVQPSVANLASGKYRYYKELHLVTRRDVSPALARFVAFLYSKQGRAVAARYGVLVTMSK